MPIALYEYVCYKSGKNPKTDSVSAEDADQVGVPFFSGCICTESLGLFNAYPTNSGFIKCRACVADSNDGFDTVQSFDAWREEQEEQILCPCGNQATDMIHNPDKDKSEYFCDDCSPEDDHISSDAATATGMYDHDDVN